MKKKFISFINSRNDIPIFHQPWWLDQVAEGSWDVQLLEDKNNIKAYFLFVRKKVFLFERFVMCPYTQFLGIWINPDFYNSMKGDLSYSLNITNRLISLLPKYDDLTINLSPEAINASPWIWNDFSLTVQHSYYFPVLFFSHSQTSQFIDLN